MKTKPLFDGKPYYVMIAGVRHNCASEEEARAVAQREIDAWKELGYTRRAVCYYRDGSEIFRSELGVLP